MSELKDIPFEGKVGDQAILLLAAAKELDLPPSVVQTATGKFIVPAEVAERVASDTKKTTPKAAEAEGEEGRPAKKAARKSTSKKAQE